MSPFSRAPPPYHSFSGGGKRIRTDDPLLAKQVLYQLSYTPVVQPALTLSRCFPRLENYTATSNKLETPFTPRDLNQVRGCVLPRKEVIQPHLPIRLPCYDLTPIIEPTFDCCSLAVGSQASGVPNFHGLTGGVYKARERIHRGMLIRDY